MIQQWKKTINSLAGTDLENMGKIENTVKFIKGNFISRRMHVDGEILNRKCLECLERTGNAKIYGTTKKIPAKVFREEWEHLRHLVMAD